jgi:hypothetical protein
LPHKAVFRLYEMPRQLLCISPPIAFEVQVLTPDAAINRIHIMARAFILVPIGAKSKDRVEGWFDSFPVAFSATRYEDALFELWL